MNQPILYSWIKTPCGRAKYAELEARKGLFARIRLLWFVFFAIIKDWNLSNPDQDEASKS